MLAAKLFAGLAAILALFAIVLPRIGAPPAEFYAYNSYSVFDPTSFITFGALVCAIIAAVQFVLAGWTKHPINRASALVTFAIVALSFPVQLAIEVVLREGQRPDASQIIALFITSLTFLLGFGLFALNLLWTAASFVFGNVRARRSGLPRSPFGVQPNG